MSTNPCECLLPAHMSTAPLPLSTNVYQWSIVYECLPHTYDRQNVYQVRLCNPNVYRVRPQHGNVSAVDIAVAMSAW